MRTTILQCDRCKTDTTELRQVDFGDRPMLELCASCIQLLREFMGTHEDEVDVDPPELPPA